MLSEVEVYSLSTVKNVGDKTLRQILDLMKQAGAGSLQDLDPYHIQKDTKLNKTVKAHLDQFWKDLNDHLARSAEFIDQLQDKGITVLTFADPRYSPYLKLCSDAPPLLYCRGNLDRLTDRHSVAVVGTRENTATGKLIAERTVNWLVENGQTIVSGLALGMDTIAHESCLSNKGHTIAVLVDVGKIYPSSNSTLAQRIVEEGGLLVAENAPGTATMGPLLVKRDRIQTGLSTAVFPIETSINGGTMHAVRAAALYERHVFVPDISKGMYSDLGIPQVQGIQSLIEHQKAFPYDRTRYSEVAQYLAAKEQELAEKIADKTLAPHQSESRQGQLV